jgi:hypothetical protein
LSFLGKGGVLGYYASAVAELDFGKAFIAPPVLAVAVAVVDKYVIQFDVWVV